MGSRKMCALFLPKVAEEENCNMVQEGEQCDIVDLHILITEDSSVRRRLVMRLLQSLLFDGEVMLRGVQLTVPAGGLTVRK